MKTLKITLITAAIASLFACASDTEKGALDKIGDVYKGTASYSKSFVSNTSEKRTTFNVFISNSKMVDTLRAPIASGAAALMVYHALTPEEKKSYDDIEVYMINSKKDTANFYYDTSILKTLDTKAKNVRKFSQNLLEHNFKNMDSIKNPSDIPQSLEENIGQGIKNYEKRFGKLKSSNLYAVGEASDEIGKLFKYYSYLEFSNGQTITYLVAVDANPGKDKIIGYKFDAIN
ncbi:hypothetical protein [Marinirhabdus gelatinilytica]|uniref:Lipoprotein n=1 Tax=Marinirhabdus gelatinilytica TaxID=1703343 RepID=A0A370QLT6_9FLAO|nr:hypothetical protein [Marinirhabdus gelatinilytica]RDK89314.1 hypothetical protein C8D94_1011200 [Marinirhabdus gelatinilytica]